MWRRTLKSADSGNESTAEKLVLLDAVNFTSRVLEKRFRLYRNLVVAVSLVSLVSLVTSIVWWRPWPLAGLILLIPFTGGFLFLDSRRISRWRNEIVRMCETRTLELAVFVDTISRFRHFPPRTLQGMLASLPTKEAVEPAAVPGKALTPDINRPAKWDVSWKTLAGTAALTMAFASVVACVFWQSLGPLPVGAGCVGYVAWLRRK